MEDINKNLLDSGEEQEFQIDFKKYYLLLKKHWKTLAWWTGGAFVLGCLIALGIPHKYQVTSKLAPELSSTATSRLASMSAMLGFSSSVLGTTDAVYPMVYPDLVHSPEFIAELFDTPISCEYKGEVIDTTLYAYLNEFQPKSVVGAVLGFPAMVMGATKDLFSSEVEETDEVMNSLCFTKKQYVLFNMLSKSIKADIDKKTLVVTISVTMSNRHVCNQVAVNINKKLKEFVTRYRTQKSIQDRDYFLKMADDTRTEYLKIQTEYANYADAHQSVVLQSVLIEKERLRNEANLAFQLYNTMMQQLQSAEAKVQQETPVFTEIISPTTPYSAVNSRKKTALAFAFLGFLTGVAFILYKYRKEE